MQNMGLRKGESGSCARRKGGVLGIEERDNGSLPGRVVDGVHGGGKKKKDERRGRLWLE